MELDNKENNTTVYEEPTVLTHRDPPPPPRDYDVLMQNGDHHNINGYLGINQAYVAIADEHDRLVFASALPYVNHVKVVPEKVTVHKPVLTLIKKEETSE